MKVSFLKHGVLFVISALIFLFNLLFNIITYFASIEFYYNDVLLSVFFFFSIAIIICIIVIEQKRRKKIDGSIFENILGLHHAYLAILAVLIIFSLLNMGAGQELSRLGGLPEIIKGGEYALMNHGKVIMTLHENQYIHYKALHIREWTGSLMFFSLVAFCFVLGNGIAMQHKKLKK